MINYKTFQLSAIGYQLSAISYQLWELMLPRIVVIVCLLNKRLNQFCATKNNNTKLRSLSVFKNGQIKGYGGFFARVHKSKNFIPNNSFPDDSFSKFQDGTARIFFKKPAEIMRIVKTEIEGNFLSRQIRIEQ